MTCGPPAGEQDALDQALASVRHAFLVAGIFSLFINILMLAGPLYMLQVYDRVLTSHSIPTLVALTVLLIVLYIALGLLEGVRSQVLNRVAGRLDRMLGPAALETISRWRLETGRDIADERCAISRPCASSCPAPGRRHSSTCHGRGFSSPSPS